MEKKPPEYEYQAARVPVLNWFIIGSSDNRFHLTFSEPPVAIIIELEANFVNYHKNCMSLVFHNYDDIGFLVVSFFFHSNSTETVRADQT